MFDLVLFNQLVALIFLLCYAYQFVYIPVSIFGRWREKNQPVSPKPFTLDRLAVLICARNEEQVIGHLLDSVKRQDVPADRVDIFVAADNCTDQTARVARQKGATVWERFNTRDVGKGYALTFLLQQIDEALGLDAYEAFLVLDADNVLEENFIREICHTLASGYPVVTSYRNSKNYGDNWISAGYALWFLRESRYLNEARMRLGTSCAVSGTGFVFSRSILEENGGWPFHLLTEDIEFSIDTILRGHTIGCCPTAILYDEQPVDLIQSWHQRLRWAKGYLQVLQKYGKALLAGLFKGRFACFDMTMAMMPAMVLSLAGSAVNLVVGLSRLAAGTTLPSLLAELVISFSTFYGSLLFIGAVTTWTEWHQIHATRAQKLMGILTFPLFMMTYLPISLVALFTKVTWKPIAHHKATTLAQIKKEA